MVRDRILTLDSIDAGIQVLSCVAHDRVGVRYLLEQPTGSAEHEDAATV